MSFHDFFIMSLFFLFVIQALVDHMQARAIDDLIERVEQLERTSEANREQ